MKEFSYSRNDKGEWQVAVHDVPDDDTPQKRRVQAMAEADPGRMVVGWLAKGPDLDFEDEKYLDELGPKGGD